MIDPRMAETVIMLMTSSRKERSPEKPDQD